MEDVIKKCYNFSKKICDRSQRGASHNEEHMWKVYIRSLDMLYKLNILENVILSYEGKRMLAVVTLIHDCGDHKYDKDGSIKQEINDFLSNDLGYSDNNICLILEIIKSAGYNNEKSLRIDHYKSSQNNNVDNNGNGNVNQEILTIELDWNSYFSKFIQNDIVISLSEVIIIRHLLSDSDKLEAMGIAGVYRCMKFVLEILHSKNEIVTANKLIKNVVDHSYEKLLLLYPYYIKTSSGLIIANKCHEDMKQEIVRLEKIQKTITQDNNDLVLSEMLNLINLHI